MLSKEKTNLKKIVHLFMAFFLIVLSIINILTINVYADNAEEGGGSSTSNTTTKVPKCTHKVYSATDTATYHYTKCSICGKYKSRSRHNFRYSKYSDTYHKVTCSCGYTGYRTHNTSDVSISYGETVRGKTYTSAEDLDTYHKNVCNDCDAIISVSEHSWSGGDTSPHICSSCRYTHSKVGDATKGRHYFEIEKIVSVGNVAACKVCGNYLNLKYTSDSILPTLPKKEEYTMVGNPTPMKEVELSTDQKIISNYMPINEDGEIIMLDENFLRVRSYTHGNYFTHYSKLIGNDLNNISSRIKYLQNNETVKYITNRLSEFGALGGYNEDKKNEIIADVNGRIKNDPELNFIDVFALTTVVSQLGDFAIDAITSPLLDWFTMDSIIKNTWLGGDITTLRSDFKGSLSSTNDRTYTIYFSELPAGNYEILMSRLLTDGVKFNIFGYTFGGIGQLLYSTLFTVGGGQSDSPSSIKGYISVAYRDINGNVICDKTGNIMTPKDTITSSIVYSGTSPHSVTKSFTADMKWTQVAGYRYKGYLVKYGVENSGNYSIYNNPSEMTVTEQSNVSVTSSFSYSGLGISIVFYYEPVEIISVQHKVSNVIINTDKNINSIAMSNTTSYDVSNINYAPKKFASLNKNFWPGYILTGYTIYSDSASSNNIIAKKVFDADTTTKMNSINNDKRYVELLTAITSSNDIGGSNIVNNERLGYGHDKIIVFEYLYPEIEIKNIDYTNGATLKDNSNSLLNYKFKLIGDNMLVKSLDTTPDRNTGYHEMTINLSNGTSKTYRYDASNYSLVQAWIYTKDLNKGTKSLYKVIAGNNTFVPSNIPSNKVQIANDFSSFANYYILNTEELMTVMNKVWADLYIEFKYYEGANFVNVSYVDEEGNTLMPPEVYKILDKVGGVNTATIPVTNVDGYELIKYNLDGKDENNVFSLDDVKVIDNGKDRQLIFVYKKGENIGNQPDIYEYPFAVIKSNDRGTEEYDVNAAMPTDEDLYANVVTDSYILENALSILDRTQRVNVILKKKYYTSNNDNNNMITSNTAVATATIPLEYDLSYQYYGGEMSNLFILDHAIIDNETVFDKGHYDKNGKVYIEADYKSKEPYLTYIAGGKLYVNNSEECTLVKDGSTYYLEVTLSGIDYEKPDMNSIVKTYENNHTVIDDIIRRNSVVNGDYLSVTAEDKEIIYLDGIGIYMAADRLSNVTELSNAGYYKIEAKSPLINGDVLFNERNVYTYSKSINNVYPSTKLTVQYKAYQNIQNLRVSNITENKDERIKIYTPEQILMNSISIYTPIVNYTELIPLTNSGDNDNQLINQDIKNVLTLDSVFSINIPHGGMHIYATNGEIPYDGYGDKAYNYGGSREKDEAKFIEKGLKMQTFSKMKLVKFSFDVYAIKYDTDNVTIKYTKLIPANTWFNLGEIDKNTGLNIEKYNFIIPVWVQDKTYGDISVRIVSNNIPDDYDIYTSDNNASYIANDVSNMKDKYILQKDFNVYVAGALYDLEVRDSDDIGWTGNLKTALKLITSVTGKNLYLPIGQNNQNAYAGYKYGLKLGYRFYFDLKTKGKANDEIIIKPNIYYVSADGNIVTKDISLFYSTENSKYNKLNLENDLNVTMSMSATHGTVNNPNFTFELVRGKLINSDKNYTSATIIGKIINGLDLNLLDSRLPQNNIAEATKIYGYGVNTTKFMTEAKESSLVENEDSVRNSTGHWYGEFYLPSSTKVAFGSVTPDDIVRNQNLLQTGGYLVVTFDSIITKSMTEDYLSYSMPTEDMRFEKEGASYEPYEINLPNDLKVVIPDFEEGTAMAIYEVGLRANDDYETEGTH